MQQLVAVGVHLDELVTLHCLHKVVGVEQRQAYMLEQVLEHGLALSCAVVHPAHGCLEHHLLLTDGQLIAGNVLLQLVPAQVQELLVLCHLGEVLQGVGTAAAGQLLEGVSVGEAADAQAVTGVQLLLEELGTGVT